MEAESRSSAKYAPLITGTLFSAQPGIYGMCPEKFDSDGKSFAARSFHCAAMVGKAVTLGAFFHSPYGEYIWLDYATNFQNFGIMLGNPARSSGFFDFNKYFKKLSNDVTGLEGFFANPATENLLSPGHFAAASRQLNQRIALFEGVADKLNVNHPLLKLLRSITAIHNEFENLQGGCQNALRYPQGFFDSAQGDIRAGMADSFPGVESVWGDKIIQIVILLTGMSRLTGFGLKDANWLDSKLKKLLNPGSTSGGMEQGIRVIHSLAPEFIAFFHLFWTLTLKDQD
jgi:hypothetical protein